MELLQALYDELNNSTNGITAYTSNRIYPNIAAQSAKKPYIVNQIISTVPFKTNKKDALLHRPVFTVDIWSTSYSQCRAIAGKVQIALQDFRGTMGSSTLDVQRCFMEDEIELPEIDSNTMKPEYRIIQDYQCFYSTS